ncbi:hypothetical protein FDF50_08225 [Clostridium botulinum]|uniref:Uncharacterized protein n=1 Tax=Clostridium botulinum TaxID=1491 RepID=A0A6G4HQ85_CLOBO|nr:hypothetical protein [Clostridium botulinum]MBO0571868.1 hypothetical protein [Clostridium botulinum]NFJ61678.1 hypothetical protein [Clostridium botulinum]NFQ62471.1 hypothetical protein [Clostridium botulinum]NFR17693.1 hypothetical protein [Clostridium botulinum]NFU16786.1 hypothetical protein [Clostridium botulinum]
MFKIFNKKRNNDKLNELKYITINVPKNVDYAEIKKSISKLSGNALETSGKNKNKIYIELENKDIFETYSEDTVQEINYKLNSKEEFITIGGLVLKREPIVSVEKEENKDKTLKSATAEELLAEIIGRPVPNSYVSKRKVKCYIDQMLKVYDYNFRDIQ